MELVCISTNPLNLRCLFLNKETLNFFDNYNNLIKSLVKLKYFASFPPLFCLKTAKIKKR